MKKGNGSYSYESGERYAHKWGYTDTRFEFEGDDKVRVTGDRYPICGYSMPYFIPFAEDVLGVSFRPQDIVPECDYGPLPAAKENASFTTTLRQKMGEQQVFSDDLERLRHSHGQLSVDEIYRVLYGQPLERVVDMVLYPESEEDVHLIITEANVHGVCLVPYGGGTNVSGALALRREEERPIASVDMSRMTKILWLDEDNLLACIESGICGRELEKELAERGYTSGHDPDSIELSTLGGWISTNASGMKKNKYGNIEDIVLEATLVTPTGDVETFKATPRNSTGVQPRSLLFGSEGNLGIITKAVLKVYPLPKVKKYGSLVFPNFPQGVAFLKELRQGEGVLPASIRLLTNVESRFGQALKPEAAGLKKLEQNIQRFVLTKVKGFKLDEFAACTIAMEGTESEVAYQEKIIFATAKRFGAISGGATNGQRGYMLTFGIAYIRDFFSQFHIMGETFETSVPWDKILVVTSAVQERLLKECSERGIPGRPYLAYRVTQTYHTGVCIYFTMAFSAKGQDNPLEMYHEVESALRQVILDNGGSLSHHHGIGKIRQPFLKQIQSANSIAVMRETKRALDPNNIFSVGNGVFGDLP
ncbi:MAG: FAD-binding oxidoreductase [Candidatus Latescibacterota bacterium]